MRHSAQTSYRKTALGLHCDYSFSAVFGRVFRELAAVTLLSPKRCALFVPLALLGRHLRRPLLHFLALYWAS